MTVSPSPTEGVVFDREDAADFLVVSFPDLPALVVNAPRSRLARWLLGRFGVDWQMPK